MAMDGESIGVPQDLITPAPADLIERADNAFPQEVNMPPDYWHGEDFNTRMDLQPEKPWITSLSSAGGGEYLPPTGGARQTLAAKGTAPASAIPQMPQSGQGEGGQSALPDPMLQDPKFLNAARSDPQAAANFYKAKTGRNLTDDIKMQQAIDKAKVDFMRQASEKMIDKGLTFDDITGEPTIQREVKDPTNPYSTTKIEEHSPLTETEKSLLYGYGGRMGGYELATGQKPPQGVPTPEGLTPQEAIDFRKQVATTVQTDRRTEVSPKQKLSDAYMKVWSTNRTAQENVKAKAANPSIAAANPPDLISRASNTAARYANLVGASLARPRQILGSILGPMGVPGAGELENTPAMQTSGSQIRSLFGFGQPTQ